VVAELRRHPRVADVAVPPLGAGRCVLVSIEKDAPGQGAAVIEAAWSAAGSAPIDFVVVVDAPIDVNDHDAVLFRLCANSDPGRDLHVSGGHIAFDATAKLTGDERNGQPVRRFPPPIVMTDEIRQRVDNRAAEFGLA
jgi:4-hydroxy-3-polyprenylbenzoate decarboxylase